MCWSIGDCVLDGLPSEIHPSIVDVTTICRGVDQVLALMSKPSDGTPTGTVCIGYAPAVVVLGVCMDSRVCAWLESRFVHCAVLFIIERGRSILTVVPRIGSFPVSYIRLRL